MRETNVKLNLIAHAFKNLPAMLVVNVVTALGAAFVLSSYNQQGAWTFFSVVMALTVIRAVKWKQFHDEVKQFELLSEERIDYWHVVYGTLLCLTATAWAVLGAMTVLGGVHETEYPVMIMMSALAAGATGITASLKKIGKLYITILLLPIGIIFAFKGATSYYIVLACLDFVFLVVMLMTQHKNHIVIKESFTLREENTSLVKELQDSNNSLEDKVQHRTKQLKELAHQDALTGIANRRELMEWMADNLDHSAEYDAAILFLDLDRFKEINDAKGHDVGDQVLKMATLRFESCCSNEFVLARWGGDEFVIASKQVDSCGAIAIELATELMASIAQPFNINGEELSLGVSIGVAFYPSDAATFKGVIHAADLAAAEVKRTGRGNLISFDDSFSETQKKQFELSRALGTAIERNEISIKYQPIINANTGRIESFEALARWRYEDQDINPEEFISLAEKTDRIARLGYWVLEQACFAASMWNSTGNGQKVSVNVSIKQLIADSFVSDLKTILNQTNLPAKQLKIEVTESVFDDEYRNTIYTAVEQLRQLGVDILIDDFGTGYSSLSRLHQFPITAIKIDRSFVNQIHSQGHVIIKSAIQIARSFNLKIIAEGVETIEQASELHAMGVDYFQGYYFKKPAAELEFEDFDIDWQNKVEKA